MRKKKKREKGDEREAVAGTLWKSVLEGLDLDSKNPEEKRITGIHS